MTILNYLTRKHKTTAAIAKERLQIILAHERLGNDGPDYLPALKLELLEVVSKYVNVNVDDVRVNIDREGDIEILELNIALPDQG